MRVSRRINKKQNELTAVMTKVEQYLDLEKGNVKKDYGKRNYLFEEDYMVWQSLSYQE